MVFRILILFTLLFLGSCKEYNSSQIEKSVDICLQKVSRDTFNQARVICWSAQEYKADTYNSCTVSALDQFCTGWRSLWIEKSTDVPSPNRIRSSP